MKYALFTSIAAAFASFANAYTTPVGANPEGNPIFTPGLNTIVEAGKPFTVTWQPTTSGTVTLVLLRGPGNNIVPLYPIVEKLPNTGSFVWTPSTALEADVTRYGIQLIDDATGKYQYTTQFGVSNPNQVVSSSSSSVASSSSSSVIVVSSSTSAVASTTVSASSVAPTTTSAPVVPASGSIIYSTKLVTITSCPPSVSSCGGKPHSSSVHVPAPSSWSAPSWNGTNTNTYVPSGTAPGSVKPSASAPVPVPSKNVTAPSSTPVVPISTGAGATLRVGGAMAVVLVAGAAFLL